DRGRVLPSDGDHLVEILSPVQKSFEAGSDEIPDQFGILFDQIVVNDDTVADRGDAAVRIPEDTRFRVAANFHAWDLAQCVAGNGRNLPRYQRRRAPRGIDIDDTNFAGIEHATLYESRPLLEWGGPSRNSDGLALEVLRRLDVGVGKDDDRGRIATI